MGQGGPHEVATEPLECCSVVTAHELLGVKIDSERFCYGLAGFLGVAGGIGLRPAACYQTEHRLSRSRTRNGDAAGCGLVARKEAGRGDLKGVGLAGVAPSVFEMSTAWRPQPP